jgi:DNA polymerase delta subunit 3
MALLSDVASQAQSLGSSEDQKSVVPIINPRAHRRERKGAGLKVAAATSAAAKQQAKPAANIAQATPFTKAKEEPAISQFKQESTEKAATSSGLSKKAAPAKRGVSGGIMQAFSKAATKPANSKKQETSQPATPSEEPNLPALSDDGEDDDDEMPQPKPRSVAGHKTRQQINQELREMMELEDEKEESKPETPEEEPIEEPLDEPAPEPEPAKEEEKEVITSSSNGRRRGRRRVMRKKQIMDDQGYLGLFSSFPAEFFWF